MTMLQPQRLILLIDDNITNLKVAIEHLRVANYEILTARSGDVGVTRAEEARPDLILLDVKMAGIDGFETCRRLKANPHTADIPVIFMTALTETEDKVRGLEAGAVDYVTKPLDAAELLARVNTHPQLHVLQEELRQSNAQLTHTVKRLQAALAEIRTLQGIIPICTHCKRIRNDTGFWQQVEIYIQEHSRADFSHGICPSCLEQHYREFADNTLPVV
jgi:DNA-binding response OmpR family regulator